MNGIGRTDIGYLFDEWLILHETSQNVIICKKQKKKKGV